MEIKEFIVQQRKLTVENKFSYCPYCKKEFKPTGSITYKDVLPKLIFIKKMYEWTEKDGKHKSWDEYYICERCGRKNITAETFRIFYGMDSEGKKYTPEEERAIVEEVWKRG